MYTPEGFSLDIFRERYAIKPEEGWDEACWRLANQNALAEAVDKRAEYAQKFHDALSNNLFVPGGRIWNNSGKLNPQLLNCFVLADDLDTKHGWGKIVYEMVVTSMTGGGCGINFSDVRPRGASISSGGTCPGPVELMRMVDACADPVRNGGGRRVALMFSLDLEHPDVIEFLDAKLEKGQLTRANISVNSYRTSDFVDAVKNDGDWTLQWKGQYKKVVKARDLWAKIVANAHACADPGVLNNELAEIENPIGYVTNLVTTNPCGEIWLEKYGSCCLGHIVLPRFVSDDGVVDFSALGDAVRLGVRFLDNTLTVNTFPLPEMKVQADTLRRIGLGTTGYADMLAMIGLRYGSEEANKFTDKLYGFIKKAAYEASVMLAVEKGPFPACDRKKHLESGFMRRMPKKIRSLVAEHGIRNCAILTQAPTGTVSILSGNCSSGIEPMFAPAYQRRYWSGSERKTELVFHPLFAKFMREGRSVDHFVGAHDLSVRDHLEVQRIIQSHVDNAVSKTINMPSDYTVEDMSDVWLEYMPNLKGTTFYRESSRGYVDANGVEHEPPLVAISLEEAKKSFNANTIEDVAVVDDCASGACAI